VRRKLKTEEKDTTATAVIVNYNAGTALLSCVKSVIEEGLPVVVVDNASKDDSIVSVKETFADTKVITLDNNLGYGSAVNIGTDSLQTDYILVMNPDVNLTPQAFLTLKKVLDENDDAALVGPKLIYPDGGFYPSARSFPSYTTAFAHAFLGIFWKNNKWSKRYRLEEGATSPAWLQRREVDWVSGACFLVRRVAFEAINGFDTGYFMYVEDLDLSWRLKEAGWRILFEPESVVVHDQGLSARKHPYKMTVAHHISTWRFVCKTNRGSSAILLPFIGIALLTRMIIAIIKEFYTEEKSKTIGR
jgi:N-acetylglucosaminyl-diphospho-decaprenol L-rhamnosyltransferase